MLPEPALDRLPDLWADRLTRLTGCQVTLTPVDQTSRVTAWSVGALRLGEGPHAAWWGMSRHSAIALAGSLLMFPPRVIAEHLRSQDDNPLVADAFGELANLAFAALDESLRAELGNDIRVWKTDHRLSAGHPRATCLLRCLLEVDDRPPGSVLLFAA